MAKDKAGAADVAMVAAAPADGVRVKAPAGMESISVGGLEFARDGEGFVLPAALVAAAQAHIRSFVAAAEREAKRAEGDAKRLITEADLPGWIKTLEQRLAALEEMLGQRR